MAQMPSIFRVRQTFEALRVDDIEDEVRRVHARLLETVRNQLHGGDPSGRRSEEFIALFEEQKRRFEITEDLRDDAWEVRVEMPGEIVGHNGDDVESGAVKWEFDSSALCDRDQVLLVTSVVKDR